MAGVECPACLHTNRPGCRFCTQCGAKLLRPVASSAHLVVLNCPANSGVFGLGTDCTEIGRDVGNTIVLSDASVSKRHARVVLEGEEYWIEDLGSRNGVYVNGRPIEGKAKLFDGSLIKLGRTILRFEYARDEVTETGSPGGNGRAKVRGSS